MGAELNPERVCVCGSSLRRMLGCRVFGHRYRFSSEGNIMRWVCERQCGAAGSKQYPTAEAARHYAAVFDHEDRYDLGLRAPLIAGLPLRLARYFRRRRAS